MSDEDFAETLRANGLVLRRMQRRDEANWQAARSWLGGRPRMDASRWPRCDDTGLPLHHLAQIDLGELPAGPWSAMLPQTGALSFFVDTGIDDHDLSARVLYTPDPTLHSPVEPPQDCPPIGGMMWEYEALHNSALSIEDARRLMLCWPAEFAPAEFEPDEDGYAAVLTPPLEDILGPPVPDVHLFKDPKYVTEQDELGQVDLGIFPWEIARRLIVQAQKAAPEADFVQTWQQQLSGRDLYSPIRSEVAERLEEDANRLNQQARYAIRYGRGTTMLRDAASEVFREMMVGPRDLFDRIPPAVREHIATKRQRSGYSDDGRHQMFGIGRDVQGQVEERSDEILLFQADTDEMMLWMWGDVGVLQFWITPEELRAGNWDSVEATFEGA